MANPIFDWMKGFDRKNYDLLNKVDDKERKELETFSSFMALRWMSAAESNTDHQLCLLQVNDINRGFFDLHRHKELQVKLMSYAGIGNITRHIFIKQPVAKKTDDLYDLVRLRFNEATEEDCKFYLQFCSDEDFVALCKSTGHSQKKNKEQPGKLCIDELVKQHQAYRDRNPS